VEVLEIFLVILGKSKHQIPRWVFHLPPIKEKNRNFRVSTYGNKQRLWLSCFSSSTTNHIPPLRTLWLIEDLTLHEGDNWQKGVIHKISAINIPCITCFHCIPKAKLGIISEMLTHLEVAKSSGWQMHSSCYSIRFVLFIFHSSRAHHISFCALNKAIVRPSELPLKAL
jgi:hypothetical protein